ncbi:hypothetical protein TBLA_0B06710 [Henningerozyma blattae CBS 6284]|uniref:Crh-like protein n=1 Tax=Henningerozyma blattae (strain ATCC 34711 / CBS 6284 / DSM 70876 / NBRC 10599 / NRRL Y-10934 / UCD 77-7) TaxID=1071380 RepID=I2GZE1_HENB6|nr:hypothetical protein TBLA_0B06710 [Tetrapisispora blattae CBS 6284]CCH59493.1 hypothetical protein TBLA_0B06710 [Tetrapisispora blattae CBS 6284]
MVNLSLKSSIVAASTLLPALTQATTTACNPLKSTDCPADTALGTSFSEDFSSESKWFTSLGNPGKISYSDDGVSITLEKRFDNPSLKSNFYIMYGKFEVIAQCAPGTGMVSSVFLQSDDLDELDIEWLGGDDTQVQSNFFSKGDVTTYDRGAFHSVNQPQTTFHNYTLDWAEDQTVWYVDGVPVRTLLSNNPEGYPQSPMALFMGIWAGGDPSNEPGTIEWAGGSTDYSQAPFSMVIKKLVVTDYSSGDKYSYGDQSGDASSIEAENGSVNGRYNQAQVEFAKLVDGESVSGLKDTSFSTTKTSSSSATSSAASSAISSSAPSSAISSSAASSSTTSSSAAESSSSRKSSSSSSSSATKSSASSSSSSSTKKAQSSTAQQSSSNNTSSTALDNDSESSITPSSSATSESKTSKTTKASSAHSSSKSTNKAVSKEVSTGSSTMTTSLISSDATIATAIISDNAGHMQMVNNFMAFVILCIVALI